MTTFNHRKAFLALVVVVAPTLLLAQSLPPGVPAPIRLPDGALKFERRPTAAPSRWWELLSQYFSWKGANALPFRRSVAFLVGVGTYQRLSPDLPAVENDITEMRNFLLTAGGFDTVYEVRGATVTRTLVDRYLRTEFAKEGLITSEDRLLFYYSGHGTDQAKQVGYLQFSGAEPGVFNGDWILPVDDVRQWGRVVVAKHLLVILDACASGLAAVRAKGGDELVASLSGHGSGLLITAGTGSEKAWTIRNGSNSEYSVMTNAILTALKNGTADASHSGLVTPTGIESQVQIAVARFENDTGKKMHPQFSDLGRGNRSDDGTFIFLNGTIRNPKVTGEAIGYLVPKVARPVARLGSQEAVIESGIFRPPKIVSIGEDGNDKRVLGNLRGTSPSWSPDGTRIALWCQGENYLVELCLSAPNGTDVVKLGFPTSNFAPPSWSADGRSLAIISGQQVAQAETEIVLLEVNGFQAREVKRFARNLRPHNVALSPDAKFIGFSGVLNGRTGLIIGTADGGNFRMVYEDFFSDPSSRTLQWHPAGKSVVFWGWPKDEQSPGIYEVDFDGANRHLLAQTGVGTRMSMSSEGRLAFAQNITGKSAAWFVLEPDARVTEVISGVALGDPSWIPELH